MSMETIERYFQELEAIKNYPEVKRDNEKLSLKIEEISQEKQMLKVRLDNTLKEVSSLRSSKANLDGTEMTLEEVGVSRSHGE